MLGGAGSFWQNATSIIAQTLENLDAENRSGLLNSEEDNTSEYSSNAVQNLRKELDEYKKLLDEAQMQHFELSKQSRILIAEKDAEIAFLKQKEQGHSAEKPDHTPESSLLMQKLLSEKRVLESSLRETEDKLRDILHEKNEFEVMRRNYKEIQDRFELVKSDLVSLKMDYDGKEKQKNETIENLVNEYSKLAADTELQQQKSNERVLTVMRENEVLVTKISALEHSIEELANRSVAVNVSIPANKSPPATPSREASEQTQNNNLELMQLQKELRAKIVNLEFDLNEKEKILRKLEDTNKEIIAKSEMVSSQLVENAKEKKLLESVVCEKESLLSDMKMQYELRIQQLQEGLKTKEQESQQAGESQQRNASQMANQIESVQKEGQEKLERELKTQKELFLKEMQLLEERMAKEAAEKLEKEKLMLREELSVEKEAEISKLKEEKAEEISSLKQTLEDLKRKELEELSTRKDFEKKSHLQQLEENYVERIAAMQKELANANNLLQGKDAALEENKAESAKQVESLLAAQTEKVTRELLEKFLSEKDQLASNHSIALQRELSLQKELFLKEMQLLEERMAKEAAEKLEKEKLMLREELSVEKEAEISKLKEDKEKEKAEEISSLRQTLEDLKRKELEELATRKDFEKENDLTNERRKYEEEIRLIREHHAAKIEEMDVEIKKLLSDLSNIEERHEKRIREISEAKDDEKKAAVEAAMSSLRGEMQSLIDHANAERDEHLANYTKERKLRKKIHNKLLEVQGNIRVICRVRPVLEVERRAGEGIDITEVPNDEELLLQRDAQTKTKYEFDRVFGQNSSQEEVFEAVQPLCVSVLDGYNVCIFAYGQTGSGKTFTMEGYGSNIGVSPRAIAELFNQIKQLEETWSYSITLSMLEIYNETIRDLLDSSGSKEKLDVRQTPEGNQVIGLTDVTISSIEQVRDLMKQGQSNRAVGSHDMNEHSSRSHSILTVTCRGTNKLDGSTTFGKLHLIDLAGSERVGKTDATGDRLKEAQSINKSLSCLGDVVNALGNKKASHVPFRNSKLTFLLQDSLGGNSKVLTFVNISPAVYNLGETVCSLNFATRCRSTELGQAKRQTGVAPAASKEAEGENTSTKSLSSSIREKKTLSSSSSMASLTSPAVRK